MHRFEKAGLSHSFLVLKVCCVGSRGFARVGEHVLVDPLIDNWRVAGAMVGVPVLRESRLKSSSAVGDFTLRGSLGAVDAEHGKLNGTSVRQNEGINARGA